jgi:hypothetical protein
MQQWLALMILLKLPISRLSMDHGITKTSNPSLWHMGLAYGYQEVSGQYEKVMYIDPEAPARGGGRYYTTYSEVQNRSVNGNTYSWLGAVSRFYKP